MGESKGAPSAMESDNFFDKYLVKEANSSLSCAVSSSESGGIW